MQIIEVKNAADKKRFIEFQYDLYKGDPHFVPPLRMDRKKLLDENKNPFFKTNRSALFLCVDNTTVLGRIAAIENKRHNEIHQENVGFFGFFECVDDNTVAKLLFEAASEWNKKLGFTSILGPVNPHLNDDSPGILIQGLDDDPVMLLAYSKPYYPKLLEENSFSKAKDLYSYWADVDKLNNEDKIRRVNEKTIKRHRLSFRPINMKKFEEEYLIIQDIFNQAWEKNWGQIPLTKEDFEYIASDLKPAVHSDFIILAFKDDTPIGMAVAFPDLNELIKGMNGSIFSFKAIRFFKYLLTKRITVKRLRIFILGILPDYDHTGATASLYLSLIDAARKHHMQGGEMAWVLEDNEKMNKAAKMLGGEVAKIYRIYQKSI